MLQGPYNSTTSLLNDNLREETLIPIKEPYASLGIQHLQGGGNEEVRGSVFSTTGNDAIVDWIFIELRNKNDNTEVLATRSALLQRDGDVVDYDGVSPVRFVNSCPDDYYVVIRHRNHLGVMTANPISLEEEPGNAIDFTNPLLPTWGTNAQREVNGVRMLWSGDTNGDGVVRYNGASNDKNAILFLVGLFTPNDVVDGYYREDVRMDGSVRYNGANNDKNAILFNVGLFTPNNIITEQLPE
ncbi:MAG: hemagglutinin protein [Bacteroidota bacterium]